MTTALNNSAVIIERRRDSDRWIPSKFPERTRTVRSVEAAREIKSSENRGSRFQYAKFTRQRKPRNRDTRFRDLIAAVKSSRDLDRSFVWTRGSQEASSAISRIGIYDKNFEHQTSRNRDTRFPDKRYRLWATQELNAGQVASEFRGSGFMTRTLNIRHREIAIRDFPIRGIGCGPPRS
jgi:hypothetical protein